jgi:peptidoglycan L-alanyl-D-glutamate endopeptidase CwlK
MRRDLNSLHPALKDKCERFLAACKVHGLEVIVTSTLRTPAEQAALYAQGRKTLHLVNALRAAAALNPVTRDQNQIVTSVEVSVHELGLAFDIALGTKGTPHWDVTLDTNSNKKADYLEAGELGESMGLIWGGRFSQRDLCHFEWTGGLTLGELKAGRMPPLKPSQIAEKQIKMKEESRQMVKAGVRSSEFYLALIGAIIPVLNTHLGFFIPVEGVLSIAAVIVSYIISRTVVKRS